MKFFLAAAAAALTLNAQDAAAASKRSLRRNIEPVTALKGADPSSSARRRVQAGGKSGTYLLAEIKFDPNVPNDARTRKLKGNPHSETTQNIQFKSPEGALLTYKVINSPPGAMNSLKSGSAITTPPSAVIDEQAATIDFMGGNPNEETETGRRGLGASSSTPEQQRNLAKLHRQLAVVEGDRTVLIVRVTGQSRWYRSLRLDATLRKLLQHGCNRQ